MGAKTGITPSKHPLISRKSAPKVGHSLHSSLWFYSMIAGYLSVPGNRRTDGRVYIGMLCNFTEHHYRTSLQGYVMCDSNRT